MCFVIAGVQPKTKVLDDIPKRCPACGLHQAYTQQVDHYLSLFFVPLLRVKRGAPFLYCRRCQYSSENTDIEADRTTSAPVTGTICRHCGGPIRKGFNYCPQCGQQIH